MYKRTAGNKYNNKSSVYNGYPYDSAMEAKYAMALDVQKKAGLIKDFDRQHKLSIDIEGHHICNYYVDYIVYYHDGSEQYHEVKGFETDVWKLKWKLSLAIYGKEKFVLIKK